MYRILFGLMCTAAAWAQTSPPNPLPNASALAGAILENAAIARPGHRRPESGPGAEIGRFRTFGRAEAD